MWTSWWVTVELPQCVQSGQHHLQTASLNQYFLHLGLCSEVCEAEEASITSGAEVYAIFWMTEGIRQQQGEDAKECWGKYAPLFHSIPNWEGVWGRAIILDSALHAFMKGCNHPQSLGGHPILCSRVKRPFLLTKSKALGRSKMWFREVASACSTSLGADIVKRSCCLLIFQSWIHTTLLGKCTQQAPGTCSAPCG